MEAKYVWIKFNSEQVEFFSPAFSSIEAMNKDKMTYYEKAKAWAENIIRTYETSIENNQNKLSMIIEEDTEGQRRVKQRITHLKKCLKSFQEGLNDPITLVDRYLSNTSFQYIKFDLV